MLLAPRGDAGGQGEGWERGGGGLAVGAHTVVARCESVWSTESGLNTQRPCLETKMQILAR